MNPVGFFGTHGRATAHMPWMVALLFALTIRHAAAAVTCEQLMEIAVATQKWRDQGHSLAMVQAEVDRLNANNKLAASEISVIRTVVEKAFHEGSRFPVELMKACKADIKK